MYKVHEWHASCVLLGSMVCRHCIMYSQPQAITSCIKTNLLSVLKTLPAEGWWRPLGPGEWTLKNMEVCVLLPTFLTRVAHAKPEKSNKYFKLEDKMKFSRAFFKCMYYKATVVVMRDTRTVSFHFLLNTWLTSGLVPRLHYFARPMLFRSRCPSVFCLTEDGSSSLLFVELI